ncbi:MAG: DegT/DnrJ/EryC1/StrS family aminotransferase, partial [Candidatus Omnitrophica bacterium]|nr:DegT/DnrJ/EryC1/StrS family aminotransferase [Candidatus Omnitrophota bacterium]
VYNVHVYHQYTLKVNKALRDSFIEFLVSKGIESRVYYPVPLHTQECYKSLGYKEDDFPVSMDSSLSTFVLPVYPELENSELNYIIETVKEFCSNKKFSEVGKC